MRRSLSYSSLGGFGTPRRSSVNRPQPSEKMGCARACARARILAQLKRLHVVPEIRLVHRDDRTPRAVVRPQPLDAR